MQTLVPERTIPIAHVHLHDDEIEAAVRVLRSGNLRQGPECEAFEREFAEKMGARYAVASANGTAALFLAYASFLQPGDEVLVPSLTFIATASMVVAAGGKPVFCDVDPETFLIDLDDAEARVTERTRAIAPVHLFGNVCDIDAIRRFADKHGLVVVWDAAQAHGAMYKGSPIGGADDFVCYSFYPTKNMFVGEGGMTCTNNPEYEERMRLLRSHGEVGKYYHTHIGYNLRMTDVAAAIGRKQLQRLDEMLAVRRRNARLLSEGLAQIPGLVPQKITPGSEHAWHLYSILVKEDEFGCDREMLRQELHALGIGTGIAYPRGLHQQPAFEAMFGHQSLPVTEQITRQVLNLPVHHGMSEADVHYVVAALHHIHRECMRSRH